MDLSIILFIVACVLVGLIAWKLFKSVLKTAFSILGIILLCVLIMGAALAIDANDFRKTIQEEPIHYILAQNETVYASFSAKGLMLKEREDISLSSASEVFSLSKKELRELSYKTVIFQTTAFTWEQSDEELTSYLNSLSLAEANSLFYIKLLETLLDEESDYIYLAFRGEDAQILPKTPLVRFTSFAPKKLVSSLQQQGKDAKDSIKSTISEQTRFLSKENSSNQTIDDLNQTVV
jgi:ABC-type Na+ efflux pump permease subunit